MISFQSTHSSSQHKVGQPIFQRPLKRYLCLIKYVQRMKGTRLYSIFKGKCPRCQEGNIFLSGNPYNLSKLGKCHSRCSSCNFKFEKEPGFFYGAMYVSYGLTVAFSVSIFVAVSVLFPEASVSTYIGAILSGLLLLFPITFRLSRAIWLNIFQKYDPEHVSSSSK